ncbi:MAG: hypothetical protein M0026_19685 [Nocardiopsaceae bacterium]|nr:hypothetical protein [Nocardiopsaceae bacterium]
MNCSADAPEDAASAPCGRGGVAAVGGAVATAVAALLLSGCTGGSGDVSGSAPPLAPEPVSGEHTEAPVSLSELTFTPVEGMAEYSPDTYVADLVLTDEVWISEHGSGPGDADSANSAEQGPPAILVFLEKSASVAGPVLLVESGLLDRDPDAEISTSSIDIPGAADAVLMKSRYTHDGGDTVSVQWDIVIGMATTPQYHIRYGAPKGEFNRAGAAEMLRSIHVQENP